MNTTPARTIDIKTDLAKPVFIIMKMVADLRDPGQVILAVASPKIFLDAQAALGEADKIADDYPGVFFLVFGAIKGVQAQVGGRVSSIVDTPRRPPGVHCMACGADLPAPNAACPKGCTEDDVRKSFLQHHGH